MGCGERGARAPSLPAGERVSEGPSRGSPAGGLRDKRARAPRGVPAGALPVGPARFRGARDARLPRGSQAGAVAPSPGLLGTLGSYWAFAAPRRAPEGRATTKCSRGGTLTRVASGETAGDPMQ